MTIRTAILLAAGVSCAALPGCASGPLKMELVLVSEMKSKGYYLEPDGNLSLRSGGGLIEGQAAETVYETRLDEEAMDQLKDVILKSGFFLEDPPRSPLGAGGPVLRLSIELGLWYNRMDLRGVSSRSVSKILAEMNRHLPDKYKLIYSPRPGGGLAEQIRRHLQ